MRLKNALIAVVVLLASGATVSLPRRATSETYKDGQGRVKRFTAGIALVATGRRVTGPVKTQLGSIPSARFHSRHV